MSRRLPHALALAFAVWWTIMAVAPVNREVWWTENIPVMGVFLGLVLTWRTFRFSNAAYLLMAVWLFWHALGGHYTFANVPFGWFTDFFGFQRNHFDRIGHFSVGFYAWPAAELLVRKGWSNRGAAVAFGLTFIMAVAAGYEIIEWLYAVLEGGDAGLEFLGSQGDVWDAQKDMLADTLGAVCTLALFLAWGPRRPDARAGNRQAPDPA